MFSGLNKLLDRNFIVGFASPALLFLIVGVGILSLFDKVPTFFDLTGAEPLKDSTIFALLALGLALLLMMLNWNILRIMEGYWYFKAEQKYNKFFVRRWRRYREDIDTLTKQRDDCREKGVPFPDAKKRDKAMEDFAYLMPSEERFVLPTKFGNAVRAFEDYSRIMYSLDAIPAWVRLNAVLPKDYRELMAEARGDMNFWMNAWFLSYLLLAEYLALALIHWSIPRIWLVVPGLIIWFFFGSDQATKAAIDWGEWVKAAFDIYLMELLKKLGYKQPSNLDELRLICLRLSQAMIYRDTRPLQTIESYREGYAAPGKLILPGDPDFR